MPYDDASDSGSIFDLYSDDAGTARARADAMSRRAKGLQGAGLMLRALAGDRDPSGGALLGQAQHLDDQVASGAQHAAQTAEQRRYHDIEGKRWEALANFRSQPNYQPVPEAGYAVDRRSGATVEIPKLVKPQKVAGTGPLHGGAHGGASPDDSEAIAAAIVAGTQAPDLDARSAGGVRAALAKNHPDFNHAVAQADWHATKKHISSLNSTQQLRLAQAAHTANESLGNIESLYDEWEKIGGAGQFPALNKVSLAAAKQLPGRAGEVASALEANIADLTSELGAVYQGGNSPTIEALRLAEKNMQAAANPGQFRESLKQARKNIGYRINSFSLAGVQGTSAGNRYGPKAAGGGEKGGEAKGTPAAAAGPVAISSDAEYDALPSGAEFIGPDKKKRRKP